MGMTNEGFNVKEFKDKGMGGAHPVYPTLFNLEIVELPRFSYFAHKVEYNLTKSTLKFSVMEMTDMSAYSMLSELMLQKYTIYLKLFGKGGDTLKVFTIKPTKYDIKLSLDWSDTDSIASWEVEASEVA